MNIQNKQKPIFNLFATCPKGLELLLVEELRELGAIDPHEKLAGVQFQGDLQLAYKACLWSRLANRILLLLAQAPAEDEQQLYQAVQSIAWHEHLSTDNTLAVHFVSVQSNLTHTLYGAQKVKDAIVDALRDRFGKRPSVDKLKPDVSVFAYLYRNQVALYLDLSGESLHKRGYRLTAGVAPLKENLAAAILLRAKWPQLMQANVPLIDPMCGSGTILIEAAMMAANYAPGLQRSYFGFLGWQQHDSTCWQALLQTADACKAVGIKQIPTIIGYDQDAEAIKIAFENIERAGFHGKIHVEKQSLSTFKPQSKLQPGLILTNPPYGERLGEEAELQPLYATLGERLKEYCIGWQAGVFTGNPTLGKQMGLKSYHQYAFVNGAIPCKLLLFKVEPTFFVDRSREADNVRLIKTAQKSQMTQDDAFQSFCNRLQKNLKHILKQAKRLNLTTYTIYDADLPDFAFLIQKTDDKIVVQEYQAPKIIAQEKVLRRRQQVLAVLPELLQVEAKQIYFSVLPKK